MVAEDIQLKVYRDAYFQVYLDAYQTTMKSLGWQSDMISSFEITVATPDLYNNFIEADLNVLKSSDPDNLTVCSFINNQGTWKLEYKQCLSLKKRYACSDVHNPNFWKISSASGLMSNGMTVCKSEFGDQFEYSTPLNPHSNSLLSGLVPYKGVWINLFYDAYSNHYSHRVKRSTNCGGVNQRACTYDDSVFQSYICSLPIITLFACQEPYCQEGLTRIKLPISYEAHICKCPSNHRVKRGISDDVASSSGLCQPQVVTEAPTGEEILTYIMNAPENRRRTTRDVFERAWHETFPQRGVFQERGGWIYANPESPNQLQVIMAPRDRSETFRANDNNPAAIGLFYPENPPQ